MAYVVPTAAELKTRYPEFADVDNAIVTAAITDAAGDVDDSWREADYARAIMALAAHMMVMEGRLNSGVSLSPFALTGFVKSESLGDASVTYGGVGEAGSSGSNKDGSYALTTYGQRYMELMRKNHGGPLIV